MIKLVGDFETTTAVNDCRVWASCLMNVDTLEVIQLVNNIDDTMYLLEQLTINEKIELYYHNLKFDGEFILSWLWTNGFIYDDKLSKGKTFKTLITDTGIFYQIEIRFHKKKTNPRITAKSSWYGDLSVCSGLFRGGSFCTFPSWLRGSFPERHRRDRSRI